MAVNSSDFLKAAEDLLAKENKTEIELRAAGSRAYYGMYHKAKSIIDDKQLALVRVDNSGSHEMLIETVRSIGTHRAKSMAEALRSMKRFRHNCDYHLADEVKPKHAAMKVAEAKLHMERLGRL